MDLKYFEKRKTAIWAKYEKEAGFPLTQKFRDYVEWEEVGDPKEYIDGEPEGEEEYLEARERVSMEHVTAHYTSERTCLKAKKPSNQFQNGDHLKNRLELMEFPVKNLQRQKLQRQVRLAKYLQKLEKSCGTANSAAM